MAINRKGILQEKRIIGDNYFILKTFWLSRVFNKKENTNISLKLFTAAFDVFN